MILGLDVSTSIVGVCVLDEEGKFKHVTKVDLRKLDSFCQKASLVGICIDGLNRSFGIKHVFIEDKLSGFSGGMTSQQTMMKLAAFNGAITHIAYEWTNVEPLHIHPSTIKATMKQVGLIIPKGVKGKDKKKLTAIYVNRLHPEFPYEETKTGNLKAGVDDMSDAYCVAKSGYLIHLCNQ